VQKSGSNLPLHFGIVVVVPVTVVVVTVESLQAPQNTGQAFRRSFPKYRSSQRSRYSENAAQSAGSFWPSQALAVVVDAVVVEVNVGSVQESHTTGHNRCIFTPMIGRLQVASLLSAQIKGSSLPLHMPIVVVVAVIDVVVSVSVKVVAVVVVDVIHPHLAGHTVNALPPRRLALHSPGAINEAHGGGSNLPLHFVSVLVVIVVVVAVVAVPVVVVALVVDVVQDPQRTGQ